MKRASLIVVVRYSETGIETGLTCESVHVNIDGTVTVFCSGTPQTFKQENVLRIEYAEKGATFCPHCDQSIENVFYGDQRKNP